MSPPTTPVRDGADQAREIGHLRGVLIRVVELLEDEGLTDSETYAFALAGAELPRNRPYACQECAAIFEWPGELDVHVQFHSSWYLVGYPADDHEQGAEAV